MGEGEGDRTPDPGPGAPRQTFEEQPHHPPEQDLFGDRRQEGDAEEGVGEEPGRGHLTDAAVAQHPTHRGGEVGDGHDEGGHRHPGQRPHPGHVDTAADVETGEEPDGAADAGQRRPDVDDVVAPAGRKQMEDVVPRRY